MKTIGLIGGMSWESTVTYYQIINNTVKEKLGGFHSAKCLLYSVDFHEIEQCQAKGQWDESAEILTAAAITLEKAGADFVVICTNTMHKVAEKIQSKINIPLIHIAEPTIQALKEKDIKKVGLLGTKYTMQQDFYKSKIIASGIEVVVPNEKDIEIVNSVIYKELCLGEISSKSKAEFLRIVGDLQSKGAKGIILGCTEIGLLIKQSDTDMPLFDTAFIHAQKAALMSLK